MHRDSRLQFRHRGLNFNIVYDNTHSQFQKTLQKYEQFRCQVVDPLR